jgi:hypothetical protein
MNLYRILADVVVAVHLAYVSFVVLGMLAILIGLVLRWSWVRNFWFRSIHLLMIAIVAVEAMFGILCPLTGWENRLREAAGDVTETRSFVGQWMHNILFVDVPRPVMNVCYIIFGLTVLLVYIFAPPRWPRRKHNELPRLP